MNNADRLLESTLSLRKLNEENRKNLLALEIDLKRLPHDTQSTIREYINIQNESGLLDLDILNLEVWHQNKMVEMTMLEQETLKPLQRKVKNVNREIEKEKQKVDALKESITHFKSSVISEEEMKTKAEILSQSTRVLEERIADLPKSPLQLDIDGFINKVNSLKMKKTKQ